MFLVFFFGTLKTICTLLDCLLIFPCYIDLSCLLANAFVNFLRERARKKKEEEEKKAEREREKVLLNLLFLFLMVASYINYKIDT